MNKYYLHNGSESTGPFNIEDLKTKQITVISSVWCEGMQDWQKAGEIAELKNILALIPPPIKELNSDSRRNSFTNGSGPSTQQFFGINKNVFMTVVGISAVVFAGFIFNAIQENRSLELEQTNFQTQKNNDQYVIQQKEIEEQKSLLIEKERLEADRILKEKIEAIKNKLIENQELLKTYYSNLEDANTQLVNVTGFKLLRFDSERTSQITNAQEDISYWQNEINLLEEGSNQLNLELKRQN